MPHATVGDGEFRARGRSNMMRQGAADIDAVEFDIDAVELKVECYAGHRGKEEPRAFLLGNRRVPVVDILDRWRHLCAAP